MMGMADLVWRLMSVKKVTVTVTHMQTVQILQDRMTVHVTQDIQATASHVLVCLLQNNFRYCVLGNY